MIRTDEENQRWWQDLSLFEREELFENLIEQAPGSEHFLSSIQTQYKKTGRLTEKQLAAVRKYHDNAQ